MIDAVRELLAVDEWRDAEVVERGGQREVRMSYRTACHNYALGAAAAFFMAATLFGYPILWADHLPASISATAVPFFVVFSAAGFGLVAVAYVAPVRFYELMEGERDE